MGRSRGGLTTKIHALVDADGRPVRLELTPGQADDAPVAASLLACQLDASKNLAKSSPWMIQSAPHSEGGVDGGAAGIV
jgi:transposase